MEVLKQISPTRAPVAPKDCPSKYRPSSNARMAFIFLRPNVSTLNAQRSTLNAQPKIHSGGREAALRRPRTAQRAVPPKKEKRPGLIIQPRPYTKYYPAYAVKADIPFPFGNGRMTVAAASDFQLRRVIFFVRPSLLC